MEIIFIPLLIIITAIRLSNLISKKKEKKKRLKWVALFKQKADIVKIDLSTINIKHHTWEREVIVDIYGNETKPQNTNAKRYYNFKNKRKYQSKLTIPVNYKNNDYIFKTILSVDGQWLGIKFYLQKYTNIYIDKNDIENSYIDFSFLEIENEDLCAIHTNNFKW
ncbi:MAG: hypothetical protein ACK5MZ_04085 [Aestuariibaculum sp.]